MRPLNQIVGDFYRTTDRDLRYDAVIASARIALRAYVSTTFAIHGRLHLVEPANTQDEQLDRDSNQPAAYREAAMEALVHFQHFAELVVKDALRGEHELLVTLTTNEHDLLYRLLHGEQVDPLEAERTNTIDASVALERLCALRTANRLPDWEFVRERRQFLSDLNKLRNRIWHRGRLVLRYRGLDELFGGYALPFLRLAMGHPSHQRHAELWKHPALHCGLDPFALIEQELTAVPAWSVTKVAFLKELARASYESPLTPHAWFEGENEARRERAVLTAQTPVEHGACDVRVCPVCGTNALVVYGMDGDVDGEPGPWYTYLARCELCTLELRSDYGNPSDHGFGSIPDLWEQG